jgi:hypothetical protein
VGAANAAAITPSATIEKRMPLRPPRRLVFIRRLMNPCPGSVKNPAREPVNQLAYVRLADDSAIDQPVIGFVRAAVLSFKSSLV